MHAEIDHRDSYLSRALASIQVTTSSTLSPRKMSRSRPPLTPSASRRISCVASMHTISRNPPPSNNEPSCPSCAAEMSLLKPSRAQERQPHSPLACFNPSTHSSLWNLAELDACWCSLPQMVAWFDPHWHRSAHRNMPSSTIETESCASWLLARPH